jgi:transcriptional regulator with XRE-family HTH domain
MIRFDGSPIQVARGEAGLSREEVAVRARVSYRTLSNVELGLYVPGSERLARICQVVGLDIRECFYDDSKALA